MARILKNPEKLTDRVIVEYSPEEILPKNVYLRGKENKTVSTGEVLGNAIQSVAWRDLCINAPQVVEKRDFSHGNIQVIDGLFVITFFDDPPMITEPPGEEK